MAESNQYTALCNSSYILCTTQLSKLSFGASLIAQLVKNQAAMKETPVQFLGWEDPLEKG